MACLAATELGMPFTNSARSGLNEELWQFFCQQGELKDYPLQAVLLRQDEPIDQIYLIESGLVKLTRTNAQGREVIVGLRFYNTLLGVASAISDNPAAASAATLEASRIHSLPAKAFLQQMGMNSKLAKQVARAIGQNYYTNAPAIGSTLSNVISTAIGWIISGVIGNFVYDILKRKFLSGPSTKQ